MTTKICHGILHPEGLELPTNVFDSVPVRWITKDGIKHSTFIPRHICKDCRRIDRNNYNKLHIVERTTYNKEWLKTPEGKACIKKARKKYYYNNREDRVKLSKCLRIKLSDGYVKTALHSIKVDDPDKTLIKIKRLQLTLYRESKKKVL